jgi:phospholipid/cholesterol/gamma-HCH transport system permease protein
VEPETAADETFTIERDARKVSLGGELRMSEASAIWRSLRDVLAAELAPPRAPVDGAFLPPRDEAAGKPIELDLSGASALDGAILSLVNVVRSELESRGLHADLTGVPSRFHALLELYDGHTPPPLPRPPRKAGSAIEQVGRRTERLVGEMKQAIAFLGDVASAVPWVLRHPRAGHWRELPPFAERTGADAVPIVALLNFLLGFVTAYQAIRQLKLYGANLYVADLVGISVSRELAPLITAIIVCGRTGAAFTAEIGTMMVSDEIDALRALGIRPVAWLVLPRVLALCLVVPLLTMMADVVGVVGGMVVAATSLDITPKGYLMETQSSVTPWDVVSGLIKSMAFALVIGLISCQQGFSASGGAESVGRRTTATVVACLFHLVVIDAVLTVIFRLFHS